MTWITELKVSFERGAMSAELIAPLTYSATWCGSITAPAGFITDFASVPGQVIFPGLVPKVGRLRDAAVIHDYLYRSGGGDSSLTRAESDRVFRDGMRELGVQGWRRWLAWTAVRVGGRSAWMGT